MEIQQEDNVKGFIDTLEKKTISKVIRYLKLLEQFGSALSMPYARRIGNNLYELRIRGIQEVRLFYLFKEHRIHLIYGFIKKSQKIPMHELEKIKRLHKEAHKQLDE